MMIDDGACVGVGHACDNDNITLLLVLIISNN
jgi:hypothetical protein